MDSYVLTALITAFAGTIGAGLTVFVQYLQTRSQRALSSGRVATSDAQTLFTTQSELNRQLLQMNREQWDDLQQLSQTMLQVSQEMRATSAVVQEQGGTLSKVASIAEALMSEVQGTKNGIDQAIERLERIISNIGGMQERLKRMDALADQVEQLTKRLGNGNHS